MKPTGFLVVVIEQSLSNVASAETSSFEDFPV